jgi:hypothetical protein
MRQIITIVVFLFASLASVSAQGAEELLTKLDNSLGERYAMHITVTMSDQANGDTNLNGYFMVEGDAYYITLGVMEVYSDGKLRYEINNERKEVVEDRVNLESCDLLSNPTRAFTFVPKEFSSEVVSRADSRVVVRLTPKSEAMGIDSIELTLEESGSKVLPVAICYDYDGDKVSIALAMADTADMELPRWSKSAYRAYDIVSFL